MHTIQGKVPLPLLLSVGLFESDKIVNQNDHNHHEHEHEHEHHVHSHYDHGHHHRGHQDHEAIEGFTSLSFESDGPLRKFQNFLDNQLPQEVFRSKGILWFQESERRHVFHLTGKRFSINDSDWTGKRKNQIVMIGRDIDHDSLRKQLEACVTKNPD